MYGGSAGGGKSAALLASALQYVSEPNYAGLLLRRRFSDLELPGSLIPLSHKWLHGTKAEWAGDRKQWRFPSGARLNFGYLETENDKYRYQSSEWQFVGFDELTQFVESQYRYMFSRLRKLSGSSVPLRMRSASNPGGVGHEWVRQRFILDDNRTRLFVPAKLDDNPYLDSESYLKSLEQLDPVTRKQLREGDWSIRPEGNMFKRAWFEVVDNAPPFVRCSRGWDFAATEEIAGDPDYTVGTKIGVDASGTYYICDVVRTRSTPYDVEKIVAQCAAMDGKEVTVRLEQEPGASGKSVVSHFQRNVLLGYTCVARTASGDKVTRAKPLSAAAEQRRVKLVRGAWNSAFIDEVCAFPGAGHDDQVDATVNGFDELTVTISFESDIDEYVVSASG